MIDVVRLSLPWFPDRLNRPDRPVGVQLGSAGTGTVGAWLKTPRRSRNSGDDLYPGRHPDRTIAEVRSADRRRLIARLSAFGAYGLAQHIRSIVGNGR